MQLNDEQQAWLPMIRSMKVVRMNLKRLVGMSTLALTTAMLSACSARFPEFEASHLLRGAPPKPLPDHNWQDAQSQRLPEVVRSAVNKLVERIPELYRAHSILVGTVVDANQVGSSTALSRVLSEQLQSSMVAHGFGVIDTGLRETAPSRDTTGEQVVPRDASEQAENTAKTQPSSLMVMGTYTAAETVTFVHLKAIRTVDGVIESSSEFVIPNDVNVRKLLGRY